MLGHVLVGLALDLVVDPPDRCVELVSAGVVKVLDLRLGAELERGQEDEVVAWEEREEVHALVELSCVAVGVPGVGPVLDDRFAHLFGDHALDKNAWVEGLIHICNADLGLVKELTEVDQIDDPAEGFGSRFDIGEILVK